MPAPGRPEQSGLCDDAGDISEYPGKTAFFNLR